MDVKELLDESLQAVAACCYNRATLSELLLKFEHLMSDIGTANLAKEVSAVYQTISAMKQLAVILRLQLKDEEKYCRDKILAIEDIIPESFRQPLNEWLKGLQITFTTRNVKSIITRTRLADWVPGLARSRTDIGMLSVLSAQ